MLNNLNIRDTIALILVVAMMAMAFLLSIRAPDTDAFKMVLGAMTAVGFASIIAFYFGSSTGSKAKDDTLNSIAASVAPTTATNGTASASTLAPAPAPPAVKPGD